MDEIGGETIETTAQASNTDVSTSASGKPIRLRTETGGKISALVTARGTEEGLVLRLDGRAPLAELRKALDGFVAERKGFLQGNEVLVEWAGGEPAADIVAEVSSDLKDKFNIAVAESRTFQRSSTGKEPASKTLNVEKRRDIEDNGVRSLFDGIEALNLDRSRNSTKIKASAASVAARSPLTESVLWDDADCRLICTTLRSGQRIGTEHSVIICGDVNSGAEIVAGGDIVVLGSFRGVAHAGAYEESGGGRFIFALDLRPTQLRIGTVITRGGASDGSTRGTPEIARVDGDTILVEKYQARQVAAARSSVL